MPRHPSDLHKENFYEQRHLHRRPGRCRFGRDVLFRAALRQRTAGAHCAPADLEPYAGACPADDPTTPRNNTPARALKASACRMARAAPRSIPRPAEPSLQTACQGRPVCRPPMARHLLKCAQAPQRTLMGTPHEAPERGRANGPAPGLLMAVGSMRPWARAMQNTVFHTMPAYEPI